MLTDDERRALDDIERQLVAQDLVWSARFAAARPARPGWFHHLLVAAAALMVALSVVMVFAAVVSLAAIFAGLALAFVLVAHAPPRTAAGPRGEGTT